MHENLFVTDFDGTLLTDAKVIRDRDLETLSRLREDKTITAIATGRSLYSFQRALSQMGLTSDRLPVDYLVFSTGAGIYSLAGDRLLLSHAIPRAGIQEICAYFDCSGFDYMVHKSIPDTPYFRFKMNSRNENPDFNHRIDLYPSFGSPLEGEADLYDHATEVLAIVPEGIDREGVARIQSDLDRYSVIHATSPLDHRSAWIEVFHKNVSKSLSIGWLARHLDICRTRVVSVGNDYNDKDLLEWSGLGFLVDNGPEDMKEGFGLVDSNNSCGVSQAARVAGLL
ncbi:MAG: HAD hydrolase family protein [Desulfobacterales bacterium]|nr:HAD hydrolase family protein [Desulfobacterales bacterium]